MPRGIFKSTLPAVCFDSKKIQPKTYMYVQFVFIGLKHDNLYFLSSSQEDEKEYKRRVLWKLQAFTKNFFFSLFTVALPQLNAHTFSTPLLAWDAPVKNWY